MRAARHQGEQEVDYLPGDQAPRLHSQKRSVGAAQRDEWLRAAWRVMLAGAVDPSKLVFVDEMGTNTSLAPR